MNPIFLAVALTVSTNRVSVHFDVPKPGAYRVMQTSDWLNWRVVASGPSKAGDHVTAKLPDLPFGVVRVEFVPSAL